jgi:hypothetical protein
LVLSFVRILVVWTGLQLYLTLLLFILSHQHALSTLSGPSKQAAVLEVFIGHLCNPRDTWGARDPLFDAACYLRSTVQDSLSMRITHGGKLLLSLPLLKKVVVQACDWIADCPIEGCSNQCQVSSHVGNMLDALEDTAWDLDWWQVCPELALRTWRAQRIALESEAPAPAGVGSFPRLLTFHVLHFHTRLLKFYSAQQATLITNPLPCPHS